jgi:hypothetical protein
MHGESSPSYPHATETLTHGQPLGFARESRSQLGLVESATPSAPWDSNRASWKKAEPRMTVPKKGITEPPAFRLNHAVRWVAVGRGSAQ